MSTPRSVFSTPSRSATCFTVVPGPRIHVAFLGICSSVNLPMAFWLSTSSSFSTLTCLLPCMRNGTKGPFRNPCSFTEKASFRIASSSASMISRSVICASPR